MTNETAADNVSELHVTVHKIADSADAQKKKKMKKLHVSWHKKTDISIHEEDSTIIQKTIDNVRLSAHDNQH